MSLLKEKIISDFKNKKINFSQSEVNWLCEFIEKNKLQKNLEFFVNQKKNNIPLAKIINEKGFWNLVFYTNFYTLDPRPESELLIETVLNDFNKNSYLQFLDLCCGTGCLGISLLDEIQNSFCFFSDISADVLKVTDINVSKFDLHHRSKIISSNLFEQISHDILNELDFIICNPPYINEKEIFTLNKSTLFDPLLSLNGGIDGMFFYNEILNFLKRNKISCPVYFEIDDNIFKNLKKINVANYFKIHYVKSDYHNIKRVIKISLRVNN